MSHIINTYRLYKFDEVKKKKYDTNEISGEIEKLPQAKTTYYIVEKGDTLYSIAKKFETSVAVLKEINTMNDNILSIGQQLIIK